LGFENLRENGLSNAPENLSERPNGTTAQDSICTNSVMDFADDTRLAVRVREACRITGIGRSKLYELIADGEIPTIKVGAVTLLPVDGLRAFLNRNRT
jgi:excisionase family DNA binding protein